MGYLSSLVQPSLTAGISQYNPIQSAKYCNLIGWSRATELNYIVKCPQCLELLYCRHLDQTALRLLGRPMFDLMATEVSDLAVLCMIMKRRLDPLFTYSGDPMHP